MCLLLCSFRVIFLPVVEMVGKLCLELSPTPGSPGADQHAPYGTKSTGSLENIEQNHLETGAMLNVRVYRCDGIPLQPKVFEVG